MINEIRTQAEYDGLTRDERTIYGARILLAASIARSAEDGQAVAELSDMLANIAGWELTRQLVQPTADAYAAGEKIPGEVIATIDSMPPNVLRATVRVLVERLARGEQQPEPVGAGNSTTSGPYVI